MLKKIIFSGKEGTTENRSKSREKELTATTVGCDSDELLGEIHTPY